MSVKYQLEKMFFKKCHVQNWAYVKRNPTIQRLEYEKKCLHTKKHYLKFVMQKA